MVGGKKLIFLQGKYRNKPNQLYLNMLNKGQILLQEPIQIYIQIDLIKAQGILNGWCVRQNFKRQVSY